ncbi:MAG: hypothetical protein HYX68_17380 [Planctomycetes bacterium]|jgi:hypothetical protein|nr:hypothetical protein [Planctomycetota bacterium]
MPLLDTEAGKRRLLTVEIPVLERYNQDRADDFKIKVVKHAGTLLLRYRLKPMHNVYELETRLPADYPTIPPETRVITLLDFCPHLLDGQVLCMWKQGSTRETSRWDPAKFTCVFAVQAAWRWLACYEVWRDTGDWPLPDAK